jgi:hypothetical protein
MARLALSFLGPFEATLEGVPITAFDSNKVRALLALVDKSLLHRAVEGRYEVHELLRQYAAEQIAALPDGERAVRDRHAAYYAGALERWAADPVGPRQQAPPASAWLPLPYVARSAPYTQAVWSGI